MLSGCARECAHTREEFANDVAKIYNIVNYRPRHPQTLFRKHVCRGAATRAGARGAVHVVKE